MNKFKTNKIIEEKEEIAELLRTAREEKKVKLKEVAGKLKINIRYLEALEKGEFEKLPIGVYGKNFLKEYAIFLGLDYKKIIKIFEEVDNLQKEKENKNLFSKQKVKKHSLIIFPKILKFFLIIAIVVICFVYLGLSVKKVLEPPFLEVTEPSEDYISESYNINVVGSADSSAQVFVNGDLVFLNENGYFVKNINLKEGVNKIIVIAKKRYGRDKTIERQILVK